MPKISSAISTSNFKDLSAISHSIKSAFGNVGAMKCHSLCFELEKKGKALTINGAEALYHMLVIEVKNFKNEYQTAFQSF